MYYGVSFAGLAPKAPGVTLHIVQPWADNMESWFVTALQLQDFMLEARKAEAAILAGDVTFGPSRPLHVLPCQPALT